MKLKEFESKVLLEKCGISVPEAIVYTDAQDIEFVGDRVIKVQTLRGGRGKDGGVVVGNCEVLKKFARKVLGEKFRDETVDEVLIEQKVEHEQEFYLGVMFDTSKRCPVIIFSTQGGVDIESVKKNQPEKIVTFDVDYTQGFNESDAIKLTEKIGADREIAKVLLKLYECFIRFDCTMVEVNPLVKGSEGYIALDAKVAVDDNARYRAEVKFEERTGTRTATKREILARKIDEDDHRGVAGKTFLDLDGDIAIMTSGGGASMTLMDALVKLGGKPANFTEYSGNPPTEKVEKLTRIVLDKGKLNGLLVAGVIANFTNIYETLKGIVSVLIEKKPTFPIVIRRAGPHDEEAKAYLMKVKAEHNLNIQYYNEDLPLTKAAELMVELAAKHREGK